MRKPLAVSSSFKECVYSIGISTVIFESYRILDTYQFLRAIHRIFYNASPDKWSFHIPQFTQVDGYADEIQFF
jgi:hypothetical protein